MRAVQLTAFGNPVDGLEYVDIPEPDAPGPNQVLIGVEFSPINPNDLLLAQGIYAFPPAVPTVFGNEGGGRVLAVGWRTSRSAPASCRRFPASPGESGWSFRRTAFSRCPPTRTRSSWRCWRSIPRPRRCCSAGMSP